MTPGPLIKISPSSAILTCEPGTGGPTVPKRVARGLLTQVRNAGLSEAVALEHEKPGCVEPFLHLPTQRQRSQTRRT